MEENLVEEPLAASGLCTYQGQAPKKALSSIRKRLYALDPQVTSCVSLSWKDMQSATQERLTEINGRHKICSVVFTEDGQELVSGGDEGILRRWGVNDGNEIGEATQEHSGKIVAVALSPDQRWVVCGHGAPEAQVRVWNAETHENVLEIDEHSNTVSSVDVSSDGIKFATGGMDKQAFVWDMETGKRLVGPIRHDSGVVAVRFSPRAERLATASVQSIQILDSDNGNKLRKITCQFKPWASSPLVWSGDGQRLFVVSFNPNGAKSFDASSGALLGSWSIPGDTSYSPSSIALSRNQKFIAIVTNRTLSFRDVATHQPIGRVVEHTSRVLSIALSPKNDYIATGEESGKITLRNLYDLLPDSYFPVNLPLVTLSNAAFNSWTRGELFRSEQFLSEEVLQCSEPCDQSRILALRALVRYRLKQPHEALDDAKRSIEIERSVIGHVAHAMTYVSSCEHELAIRAFDLVFTDGLSTENNFLLLIKAIILFECGKHEDAVSRVDDLIKVVDDNSLYTTLRGHMHLQLAEMSLAKGDHERAVQLLTCARENDLRHKSTHIVIISLIFGWDFDGIAVAIQRRLYECIKPLEDDGDVALHSKKLEAAIQQYSVALSLGPPNPGRLLIKRSKARIMSALWEDALNDADEAIIDDPKSPWGYESKHAALHALKRYPEAMEVYTHMQTLINSSPDHEMRQLGRNYVPPARLETAIDKVIRSVLKVCPIVVIDVKTGFLCNEPERTQIFKSDPKFKELMSSMTLKLDDGLILRVVGEYFQYVTFSHVWEGDEPSYQQVKSASSVWDLDISSPLNAKLRKFCEVVQTDGYRWAWSDTCCIDKTISAVLSQSLKMMYRWYEASAATFVLLAGVDTPSVIGNLTDSIWMTRAWTAQELLSPKVIRFYDRNWNPYLGDTRTNHKESPEIMQELADAIGIAQKTIISFHPDDLSIRQRLRLASARDATREEDIAYSLIGIFKSDIQPQYGEGNDALGRLLEETVGRKGDVSVLNWTGRSSQYNSCLPASLAVYGELPRAMPIFEDIEMNARAAALRPSMTRTNAMTVYHRIAGLHYVRFAHRRLYLPCIVFVVKKLEAVEIIEQDASIGAGMGVGLGVGSGSEQETLYRAQVAGVGSVEFRTADRLSSPKAPGRLLCVRPWISEVRDPYGEDTWEGVSHYNGDGGGESGRRRVEGDVDASSDANYSESDYMRALWVMVRLGLPFEALLLQQQVSGEYKRVAAEHAICVSGLEPQIDLVRDIHTKVVEIL